MEITIEDRQTKVHLNALQIIKLTKEILRQVQIIQASLSIVFVSRQKITALNKKFLHRDHATDVLAFDVSDHGPSNQKRKPKTLAGDIIISTDAVIKNSKEFGTTRGDELTLYIIHGILHLLGYDDHKECDIKKIRKKEKEILNYLRIKIQRIIS